MFLAEGEEVWQTVLYGYIIFNLTVLGLCVNICAPPDSQLLPPVQTIWNWKQYSDIEINKPADFSY